MPRLIPVYGHGIRHAPPPAPRTPDARTPAVDQLVALDADVEHILLLVVRRGAAPGRVDHVVGVACGVLHRLDETGAGAVAEHHVPSLNGGSPPYRRIGVSRSRPCR